MTQARASTSHLRPVPFWPRCVSSDAEPDGWHYVSPFPIEGDPQEFWSALTAAVRALPGTTVVEETRRTLRAECRSRVFGFVDDLELCMRPTVGEVAVRSGSRWGIHDGGSNRRRVEELRAMIGKVAAPA